MTPETTPLSNDELEAMRRIIAQHDAKTAKDAMREFDLNKPPVAPYVYREFPYLMYHKTEKPKPARNPEERERMLAQRWSYDPFPAEEVSEIPLTAAEHAEAEEINKRLEKKRK